MLSYWEQQSFTRYHHIIIGSGLTGLSAAIEIKARFPGERVLVLERGLLPTGATTRNAGFACMGSASELLTDLETESEDEVVGLFMRRRRGLAKLRERLGDEHTDYRADGGYELFNEQDLPVLDKLGYLNDLLRPHVGQDAFLLANEKIELFEFSKKFVKGLTENTCEGGLNSGKTVRSLVDMALQLGIEIKTGANVERFEENEQDASVVIEDPFRNEELILRCETLTICTNAFTKKLLPAENVIPGRGQVIITEPIPGLPFRGVFHFDKGYYYFREIDGRVLFGGGRNLDFEGERTTEFGFSERIQQDLLQKLRDIILPDHPFKIAMRWSGIMAFGPEKAPVVKSFSSRIFGAFRMGGMGVALGSEAAAEVAALMAKAR